ncbi:MAG TPA: hypothetical protein VHB72_01770 [Candidatus Saccharimonadales bacterium]|nr:hypothetical protein [Candidatus Saccharimonadales bacterium]
MAQRTQGMNEYWTETLGFDVQQETARLAMRFTDPDNEYVRLKEHGMMVHTIQTSIHAHRIALAGLFEERRQRTLSEDESYALQFHSEAKRRLHRRNHILTV